MIMPSKVDVRKNIEKEIESIEEKVRKPKNPQRKDEEDRKNWKPRMILNFFEIKLLFQIGLDNKILSWQIFDSFSCVSKTTYRLEKYLKLKLTFP